MSTQPATPGSASLALLIEVLQNTYQATYTGINNALISAYKQGVATAQAIDQPLPPPPNIWVVNTGLIAQLETQASENPTSVTPSQWAGILSQVPYPAVTAAPLAAYTIGSALPGEPNVFQLSASGAFPSDGQLITVNGQEYFAIWAGPWGPVYAKLV